MAGMIADRHRNLGLVGKIETFPIFRNWCQPSQTVRDVYDFNFSLVSKIREGQETVKLVKNQAKKRCPLFIVCGAVR